MAAALTFAEILAQFSRQFCNNGNNANNIVQRNLQLSALLASAQLASMLPTQFPLPAQMMLPKIQTTSNQLILPNQEQKTKDQVKANNGRKRPHNSPARPSMSAVVEADGNDPEPEKNFFTTFAPTSTSFNNNNKVSDLSSVTPTERVSTVSSPSSGTSSVSIRRTSVYVKTSNSPDSHKPRKLKLYSADEKLDIIDYAKVIGNRAAGREFGVAESSIREWRKNEEKLRNQAESNGGSQSLEQRHPIVIERIDQLLIDFINKNRQDIDWYKIGEKAKELWLENAKSSKEQQHLLLSGAESQFSMGWVSRFMRRNESRVPKIAPPIIATGSVTSPNNGPSTIATVKTKGSSNSTKNPSKKRKTSEVGKVISDSDVATAMVLEATLPENHRTNGSRRKGKPQRFDASSATLLTTTSPLPAQN